MARAAETEKARIAEFLPLVLALRFLSELWVPSPAPCALRLSPSGRLSRQFGVRQNPLRDITILSTANSIAYTFYRAQNHLRHRRLARHHRRGLHFRKCPQGGPRDRSLPGARRKIGRGPPGRLRHTLRLRTFRAHCRGDSLRRWHSRLARRRCRADASALFISQTSRRRRRNTNHCQP